MVVICPGPINLQDPLTSRKSPKQKANAFYEVVLIMAYAVLSRRLKL